MTRADLRHVATSVLQKLREALASGALPAPVERGALVGFGVRHQLEAIEAALAGHRTAACLSVLDAVLSERAESRPSPELVWTGPEAPAAAARDTAVVLRELFESARQSVLLAGYDFDHAEEVLAPLHRVMTLHGVDARFFVNLRQAERGVGEAEHLAAELGTFYEDHWPFGAPRPRLYYDRRALRPGPPWCSLHAKCVVVDGARALVSSANFTQRGQERNIEVGVLIDDPRFASALSRQWSGLIDAGLAGEVRDG